ncbi:MAG: hypothetical protein LPJ98_03300 [Cyclobacteriaceae bacterium]|nr:hypothetical protein [Cyclobacteriaceae bacterium]
MEEKVFLQFKQTEFDQFKVYANRFSLNVNDFVKAWELINKELKIQIPIIEIVEGVIEVGPSFFERIEQSYLQGKEKPLQKYYTEFFYSEVNKLNDAIIKLRQSSIGSDRIPDNLKDLKQWPWESNRIEVNEAWFSQISEHFEVWAISKDQKEFVEKYRALMKAYNDLHEFADAKGIKLPHDPKGICTFHADGLKFRLKENYDLVPLNRL